MDEISKIIGVLVLILVVPFVIIWSLISLGAHMRETQMMDFSKNCLLRQDAKLSVCQDSLICVFKMNVASSTKGVQYPDGETAAPAGC